MKGKLSDRMAAAMPWLDTVAKFLQKAGDPIAGQHAPQSLKDALAGTWLGHPLHPAIVDVPLGLWTASLVLDVTGHDEAADLTLGLGLISAVAAAATGVAQWQDAAYDVRPRRLGALHAGLTSAATALSAGSLLARQQGRRGTGRALAVAGYGIAAFSAWLGGDLAYDLGIGVNHLAFQPIPGGWVDVAGVDEIEEGKPKRVRAKTFPVLLLKRGDRIHAIAAICPHLGGPLDKGTIEGETVTCPWHGSVFSLHDGRLIHGPATAPVPTFEVRVAGGAGQRSRRNAG
ncbi:MAG: hypothetical protein KatS3mg059_0411 [Thermomicrobiales bacterium]|nr:MAG: hypothetical protein KatS3mg059_0411 [Thermomicrobiales bacterium]